MRTYTLCFSIAAHVVIGGAVFYTTVLATDELPEPRRASEFVQVSAAMPAEPPPPAPSVSRTAVPVFPAAAPIAAPEGVTPEPVVDPVADPWAGVPGGFDGGVTMGVFEPPPAVELPPSPRPTEPVRVGGVIKPPTRVTAVPPEYPAVARSARVSGVVILEAMIREDGTVGDVRVLRSIPLLDAAAMEAVKQWRFTPTLLNGQPVPVVMTVTVTFALN